MGTVFSKKKKGEEEESLLDHRCLDRSINETEEGIQITQEELNTIQTDIEALKTRLDSLEGASNLNAAPSNLSPPNTEELLGSMRAELTNLSGQYAKTNNDSAQILKLTEDVVNAKTKIKTLEDGLAKSRIKNKTLQTQVDKIEKKISSLNSMGFTLNTSRQSRPASPKKQSFFSEGSSEGFFAGEGASVASSKVSRSQFSTSTTSRSATNKFWAPKRTELISALITLIPANAANLSKESLSSLSSLVLELGDFADLGDSLRWFTLGVHIKQTVDGQYSFEYAEDLDTSLVLDKCSFIAQTVFSPLKTKFPRISNLPVYELIKNLMLDMKNLQHRQRGVHGKH